MVNCKVPLPRNHNSKPVAIVHLGRAAGKVKFATLDEEDLPIVQSFHLESRLCVDRNGTGCKIIAFAVPFTSYYAAVTLQRLVWTRRKGNIPADMVVVFKNDLSLDCRLTNLKLVDRAGYRQYSSIIGQSRPRLVMVPPARAEPDKTMASLDSVDSRSGSSSPPAVVTRGEERRDSVYAMAVRQLAKNLPPAATEEPFAWYGKVCDEHGRPFANQPDLSMPSIKSAPATGTSTNASWNWVLEDNKVYECHNPACSNLESHVHQFSVCGRCHSTRYCGVPCQQEDWPRHKLLCNAPLSHFGPAGSGQRAGANGSGEPNGNARRTVRLNHVNVMNIQDER